MKYARSVMCCGGNQTDEIRLSRPVLDEPRRRPLLAGLHAQATEVEGEHEQVERPDDPVPPVGPRPPAARHARARRGSRAQNRFTGWTSSISSQ